MNMETSQELSGEARLQNPLAIARGIYRHLSVKAGALQWLALLSARLLIARSFLLSGLTKWDGLTIRDDTFYLFSDEYFGKYGLPTSVTNVFAVASAFGEVLLPVMLLFGIFSRAAALGLLTMTLVIQVFVYPDAWWGVHAWWTTILLVIITVGPGRISLDRLFGLDPAKLAK